MRIPLGSRAFCTLCGAWVFWHALSAEAEPRPEKERAAPAAVTQRIPVASSSILSIGFVKATGVLEVEFQSGSIYRYFGVPQTAFEEFKRAESKGRYFTQYIRGNYEFRRVEIPPK